uniref:EXPERA domain-containing protein n=1 Tax=Steinernema glaseri TaxID=37863 RepID=A0A1I8AB75_9BILA
MATALIFPLALLHGAAYFPMAVLMPALSLKAYSEVERFKVVAYTDCMPIYFVALPVLLWWRNGAQQNSVKKLVQTNFLGAEFANERKQGKVETAKHFEVLEQMFKAK